MMLIMMPECVELVLLSDLVALAQLAALAVEHVTGQAVAGQAVAGFAAVEQVSNGAAVLRIAAVLQNVQGLNDAAEFGQGSGQAGGVRAALQGPQDRRGGEPADLV